MSKGGDYLPETIDSDLEMIVVGKFSLYHTLPHTSLRINLKCIRKYLNSKKGSFIL